MSLGPWQLIIIALVILVLFGRGRISEMMGDFGKGISSFKKGMAEEDKTSSKPAPQIEGRVNESSTVDQASSEPQPAPRTDPPDLRG
ncbi:twin-arginine translocase TatA/TatE family subunit [Altererythrobacter sp.]|uniref:twin-arginine translocase TatA/TatE family subunit n=1 Tax=Altererythrobacter sp. TaxID=1872480 RepID=UPI003D05F605